jgi:hypothetical protein
VADDIEVEEVPDRHELRASLGDHRVEALRAGGRRVERALGLLPSVAAEPRQEGETP